ncbi:DsbA family protein [Beijerinckia sp. L45]|uniref:DsbA family protein n=1 Tax=Beijerinckia sp. L45 TaxID=1641855 RepID=UPI00131C35C2|nr:DsbA family protein [Beijerinckia sp. L45]
MMSLRGAVAALVLGFAAILPAQAAEFSADQTTEIKSIIKSYLLEHPEVLRDAITALDEKEKAAEADTRKKALTDLAGPIYNSPDGFVIGNPKGSVTLVEFFDYNCGYCKRALDDLDRLMKDNKDLRVILRDFPILSPNSVQASIIAVAAHEQFPGEKFWDFHRKLLGTKGMVGKDQALDVAKSMGADMDKLAKDAAKPEVRTAIQGSDEVAKGLSLNGTPSYILGDDVLIGAVGYDEINGKIGNVRKCGKVLCS